MGDYADMTGQWFYWPTAPGRSRFCYCIEDDGGDCVRVEYVSEAGLPAEYHDISHAILEAAPRWDVPPSDERRAMGDD